MMLIFLNNKEEMLGLKRVSKQISKTVLTMIIFLKERLILELIEKMRL